MRMHEHERAIFTLLFFRAFIICHAFFSFLAFLKFFVLVYHIPLPLFLSLQLCTGI